MKAQTLLDPLLAVVGSVPLLLAFAGLLGLGLQRGGSPFAIAATATAWALFPPVLASLLVRRRRALAWGGAAAFWSIAVLAGLPVYFPGERQDAVATGLAMLTLGAADDDLLQTLASGLPPEARPVPEAVLVGASPAPAPVELDDEQIALPYEGETHRTVPVVFENGEHSAEVYLMLDTGATYSTLPRDRLSNLGIRSDADAPRLTLHTANGDREAALVLLDRIWLGDLAIEGVAIAVCDDCASPDVGGLLGLNVTGGFNVNIDADRREVVFTSRPGFDRRLDVSPFLDLNATFRRFPAGRVDVRVIATNRASRPVALLEAKVTCRKDEWVIPVGEVPSGATVEAERRLPDHDRCETYEIALHRASW